MKRSRCGYVLFFVVIISLTTTSLTYARDYVKPLVKPQLASYYVQPLSASSLDRQSLYAAKKKKGRTYYMPSRINSSGKRTFVFDPRRLMWGAYDGNGQLIRKGKASGGKGYCRDVRRACRTPRGVFAVHAKRGAGCRSSKYPLGRGGAPMPYCMFFHRGYAIHGSPDVPNYNASHGCVRVPPADARWLHRNFIRIGTRVIVKSY